MSFADQLARLVVAAETGRLPADLGRWVLSELVRHAHADDRRDLRDRLLVQAALELVPDGSCWARALALQVEIVRQARAHELVAAALKVDPDCPTSVRQLFTILKSAA